VRSSRKASENGYILLKKGTNWRPDKYSRKGPGAATTTSQHNVYASSICELLQAQYPALTVEDLKPYWSRPVKFERRRDIGRLKNLARLHRDLRRDGNAS